MKMTEKLNNGNKIRTYTGKYIDVFDPNPDDICIEDIAHGLAFMPRFSAQLPVFLAMYTVGQHSMECFMRAPEKLKLEALMHDASEAYVCDIPSPIKKKLPDYKAMEHNLMMAIAAKFGFQYPLHDEIHAIDHKQCEFEWKHIMIHPEERGFIMPGILVEEEFLSCYNAVKVK